MKSGDGSEKFFKDCKSGKLNKFLLRCLLFTVLEPQNHIQSFIGTDKRYYRNELCLDTTNGETIASVDLQKIKPNKYEKQLLSIYNEILQLSKKTKNYKKKITYGLYQIKNDLNTYKLIKISLTKTQKQYDYPELNGKINTLAFLTKEYYNKEIVPTLFEYEFLK